MDGISWGGVNFTLFSLISAIFIIYRWYSFIKLHGHRFVLYEACSCIVHMLVCLSWNGNYKGFDLIVLTFLLVCFSEYRRVAFSSYCCCILHRFSGRLFPELMKYLHIERHLAANFGTNFAIFDWIGLLCYRWFLSWSDVIILDLSGNRYCHQIEMISVIKMEKGVELLLGVLVLSFRVRAFL